METRQETSWIVVALFLAGIFVFLLFSLAFFGLIFGMALFLLASFAFIYLLNVSRSRQPQKCCCQTSTGRAQNANSDTKFCTACGVPHVKDAQYCGQCGKKF